MNRVYNDEFYNESQKERFLKDLGESTKKAYSRVLKRVSIMENKLNKDLYDFNLQEISQFFLLLKSTKISSLQQTGSIVKMYIDWAIEQDLRKDNINPLAAVASFDWYSQFVDDSQQTLFNEDDIAEIVDGCLNYQDKAMAQGIFEGILGRENSELLNMKMKHISATEDKDKFRVKLFNDTLTGRESREITISKYLYDILRIANDEDKYIKNNGILKPNIKIDHNELIENDYIIRSAINSRVKQDIDEPSPSQLVNRRVAKISKWFNLPLFTIVNIRNSGMLRMAKELYEKHKQLEIKEIKIICDHYNIKKDRNGAYHFGTMRAEFLNVETIKRVYKLEE
ncbi:phage lytic cycle repressor MrpR family protein [Paenibacillus sp. QZ-Y1]|uniref:phage lytic cycle repressor MrpR family protein n=1 Tax=Paenibacillus sp. QZ-Y1 TaxID=3414511 RepID=UPI003F79397B